MHTVKTEFNGGIKLRYRLESASCKVTIVDAVASINLEKPEFGVAAGRLSVLYITEK